MAYSLSNLTITDLGTVNQENFHKEAQLTPLPLFLSDSDQTDVFDFGGVIRTITLTCTRKDTVANIATFVQTQLLALIDGDQSSTIDYVSDILGTVKVKVWDVDGNYFGGRPNLLHFSIKLVESSARG